MKILIGIFFATLGCTLLLVMINMCVWTWMDIQDKRHERKIETIKAERRNAELL